jgi:hypothetical protein
VNVESKEKSKQWMHIYSPNKAGTFKQMLSACQKADDHYFLGQEGIDLPTERAFSNGGAVKYILMNL